MTDDVNKHYRVYSDAGFKVETATSIVQKCLVAFPYIWVSIVNAFICSRCLKVLDIARLLACECKALFTFFISTVDHAVFGSLVCEWLQCLMCFKPADNACPWLFRE